MPCVPVSLFHMHTHTYTLQRCNGCMAQRQPTNPQTTHCLNQATFGVRVCVRARLCARVCARPCVCVRVCAGVSGCVRACVSVCPCARVLLPCVSSGSDPVSYAVSMCYEHILIREPMTHWVDLTSSKTMLAKQVKHPSP